MIPHLIIIVEGGLVHSVYAEGDATVEVMYIDNASDCNTEEGDGEAKEINRRYAEVLADSKLSIINANSYRRLLMDGECFLKGRTHDDS